MKTLIAVPCMDMVHTQFAASLIAMDKPNCEIAFCASSLIYDARDTLAEKAIHEKWDRVLWLDSDMMFEPDLFRRMSARMDEGYEFITGLYVTRKQPIRPVIFSLVEKEPPKAENFADYPKDSVFEVAGCGFGCVMTTTDLLLRLRGIYKYPFAPFAGVGEDLSFCLRATEQGTKIYCDSSIKLSHIGQRQFTEGDI